MIAGHRSGAIWKSLLILGLLITQLSWVAPSSVFAKLQPIPERSPVNPAFLHYQGSTWSEKADSEDWHSYGYVPSPQILPGHEEGAPRMNINGPFPVAYDLRTQGKVTPIKNQGGYGTCWAFATYGSLESCLLPSETTDFSENHLATWHGFDLRYNDGGNAQMATAYLAGWGGPVLESSDPYDQQSRPGLPLVEHVQKVLEYPGRTGPLDNDYIKSTVIANGAVYASMYIDGSHYNNTTQAFYYAGSDAKSNHAIDIVGWDDNYNRSNFLVFPPSDGAFIIRNSWGSGWGQGGYFYISYYDTCLAKEEIYCFSDAEPVTNYTSIYQYDPLGNTSNLGYGEDTGYFANAFVTDSPQSLSAISFYSPIFQSTYEVSVFNAFDGRAFSGLQGRQSGSLTTPGYHTVALQTSIPLSTGPFYVIVRLTTPGYSFPIPIEYPWSGYSSRADALPGESFISSDGVAWSDLTSFSSQDPAYAHSNVCLKAFTIGGAPPASPVLSTSPGSIDFGPVDTQRTLQIQNSGGGTLTWSASCQVNWIVSLAPSSGSLSAGASQPVMVNISRVNLAPGSYYDTILVSSNGGSGTIVLTMSVGAPPQAVTQEASSITLASAILNGSVNPSQQTTQAWFEWGATPSYGFTSSILSAGEGSLWVPLSFPVNDLSMNTTYHFRLVAQNPSGTTLGEDRQFQTYGPASIELSPSTTTAELGVTVNLTALVRDQLSRPIIGVPVTLQVTGANPETVNAMTDSDGQAHCSWVAVRAGIDTAIASTSGVLSNPATIQWVVSSPSIYNLITLSAPDGVSTWTPAEISASSQTQGMWSVRILAPQGQEITSLGQLTIVTLNPSDSIDAFWKPSSTYSLTGTHAAIVQIQNTAGTQTATSFFYVYNYPVKIQGISFFDLSRKEITFPHAGIPFLLAIQVRSLAPSTVDSVFLPVMIQGNYWNAISTSNVTVGATITCWMQVVVDHPGSCPLRVFAWSGPRGIPLASPLESVFSVSP